MGGGEGKLSVLLELHGTVAVDTGISKSSRYCLWWRLQDSGC